LKGEWANARSVVQAYRAYYRLKSVYRTESVEIKKWTGMYDKSIILAYFLRGKRKFSALKLK